MGLYSKRDNWFQTGALADAAEIRYPLEEVYFEHNPKPLQRMFFFSREVRNSSSDKIILSESEKSVINSD